MLELLVHMSVEQFDEEKQEFFFDPKNDVKLELEHSLVSLSKWESKHEKPFLDSAQRTDVEVLDYVRFMILTPDYPPEVFDWFTQETINAINEYIDAKMTATWFEEPKNQVKGRKKITAELIYYWIVSYNIPWDVERWHLNRLFTLIKVFNAEHEAQNKPKNKMSGSDVAAQRRALNDQRRAKLGTSG